jgi:hypothetical protein
MQRITTPDRVPNLFGAGKDGFTGGVPQAGISVTHLNEDWCNQVQEEIANAVEKLGIALDGASREQLARALRRIAGGNFTVRNASAALTADHAGVVFVSAAAGNVALTLPQAAAAGGVPLRFTFVRTDGSGNTVTIQRAAGDLIEGVSTLAVPVSGRVTLVGSGFDSWVIQSYLPFPAPPAPYVPPPPWAPPAYTASSSGFLQLSGNRPGDAGFYLAWGMAGGGDDVPGSGTSFPAASFAFAFPSACLQVVGTIADSGAGAGVLVSSTFSNAGVTFSVSEYTTAVQMLGVRYFAIGC